MRIILRLIICFFCILPECFGWSQIHYFPTNYGVKEGLPTEFIYRTFNLPNGQLLLATQRGLVLFDGHRFLNHPTIHSPITSLTIKKDWVYFFDTNYIQKFQKFYSPPIRILETKKTDSNPNNDHFENLLVDSQNRIWSTDFENLKIYTPETNQLKSFPFHVGNKNLYLNLKITELNPQQYLLLEPHGLWICKPAESSFQKIELPVSISSPLVNYYQLKDGSILLTTVSGKNFVYNLQNNSTIYFPTLPEQEIIEGILESPEGLFLHSSNKVFVWNKQQIRQIYNSEGRQIFHLNFDESTGNLWLSTNHGLIKLQPIHSAIKIHRLPNPQSAVISLTEDANNSIWALTKSQEIWRIRPSKTEKIQHTIPGRLFQINFSEGEIYLSTSQGIYKWIGNEFKKLPIEIDSQHEIIKTLVTPQHELWVVYSTREIERFAGPQLKKISTPMKVPPEFWTDNKWQDIQIDANNRIWMVGWMPKSFGIVYFDPKNQTFIDIAQKNINPNSGVFVGDYFTQIGWGINQNILFTAFGGFNETDKNGKVVRRIDINTYPIADVHLRGIATNQQGDIFFATGEGLHIYRVHQEKVYRITQNDGLPTDYLINSFFQSSNNHLWMGIKGGILEINPNQILHTQLKNRLEFSKILVNGKIKIPTHNYLVLEKNEHDLLIQFSELSFLPPEKLEFRYKFSDEETWHILDKPELNLNHLQPGNYEIFFQVFDNLGNKQKQQLHLQIKAKPPFFKSTLFYVLLGITFMLITLGGQHYLWNRQKEKEDYLQKIKEAEMKTLRSQMNPHFLFNTLNSINSYIIQNKTEDASAYLTTFSRLMRSILDNSKYELITLHNELTTLELYIKLESARLEHSFEYEFIIADQVNEESTWVPPLIIQPFAENAIWHGLRNVKSDGKLEIIIQILEDESLEILVKDNGIGRAASQKLKTINTTRKSYGIEITVDRIKTLNPNNSVEIKDLYENGIPNGTLVQIILKNRKND